MLNESDEPSKWLELSADPDSSKEDCSLRTFKTRWKSQYGCHESSSDDTSCSGLSQYSLDRRSPAKNFLCSKSSVEGASCLSEYNLSQNAASFGADLTEYDFRYSLQSDLSSHTLQLNHGSLIRPTSLKHDSLISSSQRQTSLTSGSLRWTSSARRQTSLTSGSLRSDSLTSGSLRPELCETFLDSDPSELSLQQDSSKTFLRDKCETSNRTKSLSISPNKSPVKRNKIPIPSKNSSSKKKRSSLQSIAIKNQTEKFREKKLSFFQEKLIEEQRLYVEAEKRRSVSQSKSPNCVEGSYDKVYISGDKLGPVDLISNISNSVVPGHTGTPLESDKNTRPRQSDRLSIPKTSVNPTQKDKKSRRNLELESYTKNSSSCSDIDELFKKVKSNSSQKGDVNELNISNKSQKSTESRRKSRPKSDCVSSTDFLSTLIREEAEYRQRSRKSESGGTDHKIQKDLHTRLSPKLKHTSVAAEKATIENRSSKSNSKAKISDEAVQRISSNPNLKTFSSVDKRSSDLPKFIEFHNTSNQNLSTPIDPAPKSSLRVQSNDSQVLIKLNKGVSELTKSVSEARISECVKSSLPSNAQTLRNSSNAQTLRSSSNAQTLRSSSEIEQSSERLSSGTLYKTPKHKYNQGPNISNQTEREKVSFPSENQLVKILSELDQTSERLSSGSLLKTQTVQSNPRLPLEHNSERLSSGSLLKTQSVQSNPRLPLEHNSERLSSGSLLKTQTVQSNPRLPLEHNSERLSSGSLLKTPYGHTTERLSSGSLFRTLSDYSNQEHFVDQRNSGPSFDNNRIENKHSSESRKGVYKISKTDKTGRPEHFKLSDNHVDNNSLQETLIGLCQDSDPLHRNSVQNKQIKTPVQNSVNPDSETKSNSDRHTVVPKISKFGSSQGQRLTDTKQDLRTPDLGRTETNNSGSRSENIRVITPEEFKLKLSQNFLDCSPDVYFDDGGFNLDNPDPDISREERHSIDFSRRSSRNSRGYSDQNSDTAEVNDFSSKPNKLSQCSNHSRLNSCTKSNSSFQPQGNIVLLSDSVNRSSTQLSVPQEHTEADKVKIKRASVDSDCSGDFQSELSNSKSVTEQQYHCGSSTYTDHIEPDTKPSEQTSTTNSVKVSSESDNNRRSTFDLELEVSSVSSESQGIRNEIAEFLSAENLDSLNIEQFESFNKDIVFYSPLGGDQIQHSETQYSESQRHLAKRSSSKLDDKDSNTSPKKLEVRANQSSVQEVEKVDLPIEFSDRKSESDFPVSINKVNPKPPLNNKSLNSDINPENTSLDLSIKSNNNPSIVSNSVDYSNPINIGLINSIHNPTNEIKRLASERISGDLEVNPEVLKQSRHEMEVKENSKMDDNQSQNSTQFEALDSEELDSTLISSPSSYVGNGEKTLDIVDENKEKKTEKEILTNGNNIQEEEDRVQLAIMEISSDFISGNLSSGNLMSEDSDDSSHISDLDTHRRRLSEAQYPETGSGLSDNDWNPYTTESDTNMTPRQNGVFRIENMAIMTPRDDQDNVRNSLKNRVNQNDERSINIHNGINEESDLPCDSTSKYDETSKNELLTPKKENAQNGDMDSHNVSNENAEKTPSNDRQAEDQNITTEISSFSPELCSSKFISKDSEKETVTSSLTVEIRSRKNDDSAFSATDANRQEISSYFPFGSRSSSTGKSESESSTPNISNRSTSVLEFSPLLSSTGLNATHMQQHANRFNVTLSDVSEMTEPLRESLDFKELKEVEASTIISDDQTEAANPKDQRTLPGKTYEQPESQMSQETSIEYTNTKNLAAEDTKAVKQGQTPKKYSKEMTSESESQQAIKMLEDSDRITYDTKTPNPSSQVETDAKIMINKPSINPSAIADTIVDVDRSNKQMTNLQSSQPSEDKQVDVYHSHEQKTHPNDNLSTIRDILISDKPVEFKPTNQLREEANRLLGTSQNVNDQPKPNLNSSFSRSMDDLTTKEEKKEETQMKFGSTDCLDRIHAVRKKSNILAEVENYLANFSSQKIDLSSLESRKSESTLQRSRGSTSSVRRSSQYSKDDQLNSGSKTSDVGFNNVSRYTNLNRSNNSIHGSEENSQENEKKSKTDSQVPLQQNSGTPHGDGGIVTEAEKPEKSEKLSSTVYMEKMKKENPLDVSTFSLSSLDTSQIENCKQINEDLQEIQKNLGKDQVEDASKSMSSDSNYHSCYTAPPGQSDTGSQDTTTNQKSVLSPKDNLTSSDESADIVPSTTSSTPERTRRLMWDYGADIDYDDTGHFIGRNSGGEQSQLGETRLSYASGSRIGQRNSYDNRSLNSIGRLSQERYLSRDQIQMNAVRRISYGSEGEETGASTSSGHPDGNISDKAESEVTLTEQDIDAEPTQDVDFENDNLLQTLNQKHNVINMIESLRAQRHALEESFRCPGMTIPCYQPVPNRSQPANEPVDIVTDLANQMENVIKMGSSPGRVENCLSKVINQEQEYREQIFRRICSDSSFSDSSFALDESVTNLNHAMDEVKRRLDLSNITSTESTKHPIVPRLDLSSLDIKETRKPDFHRRPFMPPLDLSRKSSGSSKKDSLLSSQYEKRYSQGLDYGTPKKHVVQCYPVYGYKKDGDDSEKKGEENKYEAGPLRQGPPVRSTDPEGTWPEEGHVSNAAREFETLGDSREYTDRSSIADSKFTSISGFDSSLTNVSEQSSSEMLARDPHATRSSTDRRAASSPPGIESSTNRSVDQSQCDLLTESGVDTSPSYTDRRIASSPAKTSSDWNFRHPEMPGLIQPVPFKHSTTTTTTDISMGTEEELSTPVSPTYSSPRDSDQSGSRFKSKFSRYRLASHLHGESDTGSVADSITTMESTHTGSDDAIGPDLPRSMMGSRTDCSPQGGIYSRPATGVIPEQSLSTIEERSTLDDKVSGESNRSDQSVGKIPAQDMTDSGLYTMTLRSQAHDTQQKTTMADSNQFVETTYVNVQTTNDGRNTTHQIQTDIMETSNQGQQDDGRRSPFDEKYRALPVNVQQGQRSRSPSFDGRMEMSGRQLHATKSKSENDVGAIGHVSFIDSQNPFMSLQTMTSDYQYPVPRTSAASLLDSQNPVMSLEQNQPMTSDYQYSITRNQDRILSPVARDTTRQSHTPVVVDMKLDDINGRQHQQVGLPSVAMDTHQSFYEEVSLPYDYPRSPVPVETQQYIEEQNQRNQRMSPVAMETRQPYIEDQNQRNQRRSYVAMETRQVIVSPRTDGQTHIEEIYSRDEHQHLREDNPVQPRITQTEKIGHTGSHSNTGPTDEVIMKSRKTERRKQSERNRPQYGHDSTSEEEYLRGLETSPRGTRDLHLRQSLEAEINITPPQDLSTMWPKYSEIYPSEAESQINPTQAELFSELVNHPTRQLIYKYFNEREKSRQMIEHRFAKERESRHQQSVRPDKHKDSDEPIPSSSFEQMNASYGEILEALAAERAKRLRRETKAKSMSRSAQKSGKSEKQKRQEAVPVQMMDSQDTLYSIPEDQSYDTLAATSHSQSQDSRDMESAITDPMSTLKHKIRLQRQKIEKERRRELKRMEKLWKLEQLLKAKNSGLIGNFVLENNLNAISSTSTAASMSESQDALSFDSTLTMSSHTEVSDDISTTVKDSSYEVHKAKMNRSRQHAKDRYEAALHQLLSSGSSETLTEVEDTPNWAKKEEKRKRLEKAKETLRVGSKEVRRPTRGSENMKDQESRKQVRGTEREKTTKSKEKGRKLIETRTKSQQSSPYKVKDRKLKSPKKPESFEISPVKWNHESTRVTSPSKSSKSAALLKGLSRNISPVKKSSSKSTYTTREPMKFHHDDTYYRTRSVSPERQWRNRGVQTSPKLRSRSCSPSFNDTQFISPSGSKKKKSKHGSKVVYLSHLYSPEFQENRSPKHRRKHREHREHREKPKPVAPPIAWYVSIEKTTKRPEPFQERVPESQMAPPMRPRAVWTIDDDLINSPELKEETPEATPRDIRSSEIIIDGELFKKPYAITLQEALITHKKDFISKSRERQKRIALATEHRQMQDYLQMERDRIFGDRKRKGKKIEYPEYKDTVYGQPRKKLFTKKEMKEITARWYRNLPEVKYRERMEKKRQENQINRLKAMVFNRKVQNSVLRRAGVIV